MIKVSKKLVVSRMVIPEEDGEWIPRTFWPGEFVYEYRGHTYGCINWNKGIAVSLVEDETPFFEFPFDALARPIQPLGV